VTDPGSRVTVTREDIEHAQAVLDAWSDYMGTTGAEKVDQGDVAYLRGLLTQAIADARAIGYTRGRQILADALRDRLDDEGL
jgi:hypothetical protein